MKKQLLKFKDEIKCFLESLLCELYLSNLKKVKRALTLTFAFIVGLLVGGLLSTLTDQAILLNNLINSIFFKVTYVLIILFLIVLSLLLIFKYKYRLSYWESVGFTLLFAIYFGLSDEFLQTFIFEPWKTHIFIPFCIIFPALFIGLLSNAHWPFEKINSDNNTFLEDNPLTKEDTTYNHLIEKIAPALFKDVYKSSFSIGVIGPWGTGKSTFLSAVKCAVCETDEKELNDKYNIKLDKKPDTIFIEFSPFLNHKEEQVIHEFFTQLSNQLSERSGRLSNLITVYSEKLSKLSDVNPWFSLFKIARNSRESRSAQELFADIKECIEGLNIKIIVAVDDLDRLNAKEILQVLKLIRNTSNFPNMVFLVALDKEYVTNALREEKEYMKERYLDKFFQLEVFVTNVDEESLKQEFISLSSDKLNLSENDLFLTELKDEISSPFSLFNFFIKNRRDIKRIVNQLKLEFDTLFDYEYKELEINIVDVFHLVLMKIHFPNTYYNLGDPVNSKNILTHKTGKVYLETKFSEKHQIKGIVLHDKIKDPTIADIFNKLECIINGNTKKNELGVLLIRLFADKNSKSHVSLTNSDVYWNYFNLSFNSNSKTLSRKKYNDILSFEYDKNNYSNPSIDDKEDLLESFYKNLALIEPNKENYLNHIHAAIYLCKRSIYVSQSYYEVYCKLLANKIEYAINKYVKSKTDRKQFIEQCLTHNIDLEPALKSQCFKYLLKNTSIVEKEESLSQIFDDETIVDYALHIFNEQLEINKKEWKENDFSIYHVYWNLKMVGSLANKFNKLLKSFFFENQDRVSIFLKQVIQPSRESHRIKYVYQLDSIVKDVFGTYKDYYNRIQDVFVYINIEAKDELLFFHKLLYIRGFGSINFKFKSFNSTAISESLQSNTSLENKYTEVYMKINDLNKENEALFNHLVQNKSFLNDLNHNIIVKTVSINNSNTDDEFYFVAIYNSITQKDDFYKVISRMAKEIINYYPEVMVISSKDRFEQNLISSGDETILIGYSKQP